MPTEETATLIISARADNAAAQVDRYTRAVSNADKASNALLRTVGNLFSAGAMAKWGAESVRLYMRQESAVEGLRSSFRRLGQDSTGLVNTLMRFNKELQHSTIYGDEQIAMIQSQGLNMGITAGKIKEATKAAIGLASAYGMQLPTAMMLIARASQGQTQMLSRYGIVLGENLTAEQKYQKLLEFGTRNMGLAEDKTKTLAGAVQQMKNAYGDAREAIGAQFAPAISGAARAVQGMSEYFSSLSPEAQRFVTLTGTLTTGMIALKGVLDITTAVKKLSGVVSSKASADSVAGTMREIEAQKALRAEKAKAAAGGGQDAFIYQSREQLLNAVKAAEDESALAAQRLAKADMELARAEAKVAEYKRATRETGTDWKRDVMAGNPEGDSYEDYRAQRINLDNANAGMESARQKVQEYEAAMQKANAAVDEANKGLKAFDDAKKNEAQYFQSQKEVQAARKAFNKEYKKSGDILKANEAATAAYNKVLSAEAAEARLAQTAEDMRTNALKTGATEAEATAIKEAYLAQQRKLATMQTTTFGRAQLALAGTMRRVGNAAVAAGRAVRGMISAYVPMLLMSAGMAGLDYAMNYSKNQAAARAASAKEDEERRAEVFRSNSEKREQDKTDFDRLSRMSGWTRKTSEEQKEMVSLMEKLNKRYNGLNLELDANGESVRGLKEAYALLTEEQKREKEKENRLAIQNAENTLDEQLNALFAKNESAGQRLKNSVESVANRLINGEVGQGSVMEALIRDVMTKEGGYSKEDIDSLKKTAQQLGETDYLQMLKEISDKWDDLNKKQKYALDFAKGETEEQKKQLALLKDAERTKDAKDREKQLQYLIDSGKAELRRYGIIKRLNDLNAERQRLEAVKTADSVKKQAEIEREIDTLVDKAWKGVANDNTTKFKESIAKLDRMGGFGVSANETADAKMKAYNTEIARLQKEIESDGLAQKKIDAANRLLELTKERRDLEISMLNIEYEKAKRAEESDNNFLRAISSQNNQFRDTTQAAISANSIEAIRLQSRAFGSEGSGIQAMAKKVADSSSRSAEFLKKLAEIETRVADAIQGIEKKITAIGTSSVT